MSEPESCFFVGSDRGGNVLATEKGRQLPVEFPYGNQAVISASLVCQAIVFG